MSVQIYDAASLLISQQTITTTTTFGSLRLQVDALPTTAWTIHVASISATTTLTLILEVSTTEAGAYSEISRFVWPTGRVGSEQVALGASPSLARYAANSSRVSWIRCRALVGGAGATVTLYAWLSKFGGGVGYASKPDAIVPLP